MAFTPNYISRELTDSSTYTQKKTYSQEPYIVLPKKVSIKKGYGLKNFSLFIKTKGEQFGDPIAYNIDTNSQKIYLNCYDFSGNLHLRETMTSLDTYLGEWGYEFTALDFNAKGNFRCEITLEEENNIFFIDKFRINVY